MQEQIRSKCGYGMIADCDSGNRRVKDLVVIVTGKFGLLLSVVLCVQMFMRE